ncbi:SMI1/KNR4 family protein [Priestia megaterium]|uniref:SMI1/KNR4 family protein n=1 Tax=Priestia megaterium TaxID=1404 RepID=UPI00300BAA6F
MIDIKSNAKRFNHKDLERVEKKVGASFPEQYINFLRKYNGGEVENSIVELPFEEIESFILSSFFGTRVEDINDIISCYDTFENRIPKGCVPIGRDVGGNIVCLNLNRKGYGYIFLWDHDIELEFEDNEMETQDLYYVAPSFDDFLQMIKPYNPEEDDLDGYEVEEVWIDPDFLKELKDSE